MDGKNDDGKLLLKIAGLSHFLHLTAVQNFYRVSPKLQETLRYSGVKPWEG
jgi:hypothetical protein